MHVTLVWQTLPQGLRLRLHTLLPRVLACSTPLALFLACMLCVLIC